jgi:hypothetical protein
MSGIVSESVFIAEVQKISVTPHLEKKWRVLEILYVWKSEYVAMPCQFATTL